MIELTYLLLTGLIASSYPEILDSSFKLIVEPLEKRIELPYHKPDLPPLLADFGFQMNSDSNLCLFPSFFLRMRPAFEAFFKENEIKEGSQRALNWTYQ